mmetsp:Transcript_30206/g.87672  ORF Transcript_30206/g.87672 Transcript_30206/m.87672 type:complete len:228 (+) Transcript_30206:30-713(+)
MRVFAGSPRRRSLDFTQIILHFRRHEHAEFSVGADYTDLDVLGCDGLFEAFLQGEDGSVDGVLELDVLIVTFLEEGLRADMVLADCRSLPAEVRTGRVHLEELRPCFVIARYHQRDAEWPHAAGLCELLHHSGLLADDLRHRDQLAVCLVVLLRLLATAAQQDTIVRRHTGIHHANIVGNILDLLHGPLVHQWARHSLLRREDDAVLGLDAQGRAALGDAVQSILDL